MWPVNTTDQYRPVGVLTSNFPGQKKLLWKVYIEEFETAYVTVEHPLLCTCECSPVLSSYVDRWVVVRLIAKYSR